MSAQLTCPYCFRGQRRKELLFRCPPACAKESSGVLDFPPADRGKNGSCPHGRPPQARRLCPSCNRDLLREYVESDNNMIAMIGDQASGKSTFVGVLVHEFRGRLGERFGGLALDLLGESSRQQYEDRLAGPIYQGRRTPTATRAVRGSGGHEPIMFVLRFPRQSRLPGLGGGSRAALTVFYDTAGEESLNNTNMEFLSNYLAAASGIVVVVDAGALIGAPPEGGGATVARHPLEPLAVLAEHLRDTSRHPKSQLRTPLAVVVTKIDLITGDFEPGSALRRESAHEGYFDDADSRDVHEEIRSWLDFRGLAYIARSVDNNFSNYRYFGVSALGHAPARGSEISAQGIQPYRVEDPMLWLLAEFGTVSKKSARKTSARNGARR